MVGAVTVLVTIVAVFLAYNANSGLPFVPSYNVSVPAPGRREARDGQRGADRRRPRRADLGDQARVRFGDRRGPRRGRPEARPRRGGASGGLNHDRRSRSALGLKYLELVPGTSSEGFPPGSLLPLSAARPEPVDLDDFLDTFDSPTRAAIQANLVEFGNALAGRGPALNAALGKLPGALEVLEPVMENLGAPDTRLERFIVAISAAAGEVAPSARRAGGDVRQPRHHLRRPRERRPVRSRRRSSRRPRPSRSQPTRCR